MTSIIRVRCKGVSQPGPQESVTTTRLALFAVYHFPSTTPASFLPQIFVKCQSFVRHDSSPSSACVTTFSPPKVQRRAGETAEAAKSRKHEDRVRLLELPEKVRGEGAHLQSATPVLHTPGKRGRLDLRNQSGWPRKNGVPLQGLTSNQASVHRHTHVHEHLHTPTHTPMYK